MPETISEWFTRSRQSLKEADGVRGVNGLVEADLNQFARDVMDGKVILTDSFGVEYVLRNNILCLVVRKG